MVLVRIFCTVHSLNQCLTRKLQPSAIQLSCMVNEASKLCSPGSTDKILGTSGTISLIRLKNSVEQSFETYYTTPIDHHQQAPSQKTHGYGSSSDLPPSPVLHESPKLAADLFFQSSQYFQAEDQASSSPSVASAPAAQYTRPNPTSP